jgi:hypothetical protein
MSARLRRPRPVAGVSLSAAVLLALVPQLVDASSAAGGTMPSAAVFGGGSTLTASAADLGGLVFEGVVTVPGTNGDQSTVKLTTTSARLTGLRLQVPCTALGGAGADVQTDSVTPVDGVSTAGAGFTLFATSVAATMAGTAVTWTPDSPPPAEQLGDTSMTDLTVELASLSAPNLAMPGLRQFASFCAS